MQINNINKLFDDIIIIEFIDIRNLNKQYEYIKAFIDEIGINKKDYFTFTYSPYDKFRYIRNSYNDVIISVKRIIEDNDLKEIKYYNVNFYIKRENEDILEKYLNDMMKKYNFRYDNLNGVDYSYKPFLEDILVVKYIDYDYDKMKKINDILDFHECYEYNKELKIYKFSRLEGFIKDPIYNFLYQPEIMVRGVLKIVYDKVAFYVDKDNRHEIKNFLDDELKNKRGLIKDCELIDNKYFIIDENETFVEFNDNYDTEDELEEYDGYEYNEYNEYDG